MIIFDLACTQGHRFEGWFASKEEFTRQSARQLVRCPVCDAADVSKVPSAKVHTRKGSAPAPIAAVPAQQPPQQPVAHGLPIPAEIIQKLRAIVKAAEDVGTRFPEEARKIHYEETPARAIRGQASREDADALREEGIEVATLPAFLTEEPN
jgi:hypothetical protein